MSEFRNEWYHHPLIEGFILLIVKLMKIITSPYVMPLWVFALVFFVGGMSIWYSAILAVICGIIGYKIWVQEEQRAPELEITIDETEE